MGLLPIIQPETQAQGAMPIYREIAWDREKNTAVWRGGNPLIVSGVEAVLSWAYRALQVLRYRHSIYTWDYGNECDALIGSAYTDELKQAEAARYVKECLLVNPYLVDVREIQVAFDDGVLRIHCVIETIYGEVKLNV